MTISLIAFVIIGVRLFFPNLPLDSAILLLLVIALIPWLSPLIKSAELPGGIKIEFQDIEAAGEKIKEEASPSDMLASHTPRPAYLTVKDLDPNLALVGLRIEIEQRLRALAAKHNLPIERSNSQVVEALKEAFILSPASTEGLQELLKAGNLAAHGALADNKIANWAFERGPRILAVLDSKLSDDVGIDADQWLTKALTILDFEGSEFVEYATTLLMLAKRDGFVRITEGWDTKHQVKETLVKLGALVAEENITSKRFPIHYAITPLGNSLLSHLLSR